MSELRIVEGRFYKTRDGQKVGPLRRGENDNDAYWVSPRGQLGGGYGCAWYEDGVFWRVNESPNDLVAEWVDSPVRTVTRKEIVPGVYGIVEVGDADRNEVAVSLDAGWHKADELRAAATVLNELADALSEPNGRAEG